jgi:tryptophan-rich sensory protein
MKSPFVYNLWKRYLFIAAYGFMIVMNYLSFAIPFGGQTNADVSNSFPTLITPAGYAFSIWGIIYILLGAFAVFQFHRGATWRFYNRIWPWFMLSCAANALWLVVFQNGWLGLSVLVILLLLTSLGAMCILHYRFKTQLNTTHRFFFQVPFSLYFGWVSVATMVNVAVYFTSLGPGWLVANELWIAMAVLIAGFGIAMYVLLSQNDYVYAAAVIWAYVAIWVAAADAPSVMMTARAAALLLAAASIVVFATDRIKAMRYGRRVHES